MELAPTKRTKDRAPFFLLTILRCPKCDQSWSADYDDYRWMQDSDLIVCCCGTVMCAVEDLKEK